MHHVPKYLVVEEIEVISFQQDGINGLTNIYNLMESCMQCMDICWKTPCHGNITEGSVNNIICDHLSPSRPQVKTQHNCFYYWFHECI